MGDTRIKWTDDMDKLFLDLCLQQKLRGIVKKTSWGPICKAIEEQFQIKCEVKQVRNHFDTLKRKYKAWQYICTKFTGLTFKRNGCPNVKDDDRWTKFVQIHPDGAAFHTKPI